MSNNWLSAFVLVKGAFLSSWMFPWFVRQVSFPPWVWVWSNCFFWQLRYMRGRKRSLPNLVVVDFCWTNLIQRKRVLSHYFVFVTLTELPRAYKRGEPARPLLRLHEWRRWVHRSGGFSVGEPPVCRISVQQYGPTYLEVKDCVIVPELRRKGCTTD